ncbi:isocitrate dehydrogenase [Salinisphaera sp.]|uniref:isocitrate dehydrogenase n=1 Tax=Salinisphaera sp. TaxID=1914330 RepID=UPI002D7718E5|nr:isocitrate dehydrogenase [Salinisphaera sp.]HET7314652.1 isocitrate dehydrogenase [Salinisphaera sp.]
MSRTPLTVIKGDGIGPAIVDAALEVLDALDAEFDYEYVKVGQAALDDGEKEALPESAIESIERTGLALKGPTTTPSGGGYSSVNVAIRKRFDLYANVRPAVSMTGAKPLYDDLDIIIVRENEHGMYSGEGQTLSDDGERGEACSVITRSQSERIIRFAFELARARGRKKVTLAHKANILKTTSGLFLSVGGEIAKEYDDLEYDDVIVDAGAMKLVMDPYQFDVIVAPNLFGDILSDLCAGLVGGMGLAPGANIGDDCAVFEAVHGSAPDIAGQNIANPTSVLLATALLFDHLNDKDKADRIRRAVRSAIAERDRITPDLDGEGTTDSFTQAVVERL